MAHSASVLIDGVSGARGRRTLFSYIVPERLSLRPGDAVLVPFGRSEREGMVVSVSGDPDPAATRGVVSRIGARAHSSDVELALRVAGEMLLPAEAVLPLLSPRTHRDSPPRDSGALEAAEGVRSFSVDLARNWSRRVVVCPPALPLVDAAVGEALRMAEGSGQVLILCPTVELASEVRSLFLSGAEILSSRSPAGVWTAWRRGRLKVAIGTRSAVWYSPRSLGGVVVLDDSHPGHVDRRFPHLDAVVVAGMRADVHSASLSLVSRVPSARGLGLRVKAVEASVRGAAWPSVRVLDRSKFPPGDTGSSVLSAEVRRARERGLEVVVVAETSASSRRCSRCSLPVACSCGVSGCTHKVDPPCPRCGGLSARWSGWDAERCAGEFPEAKVMLLSEVQVLPSSSRLVVVPEVARLAHVASSRPSEVAGSVLLAAAAAAGAGGRLVVGAWDGSWSPLSLLRGKDSMGFARAAYEDARSAGRPPFGVTARLTFDLRRKPSLPQLPDGVSISGPFPRSGGWEVEVRCEAAVWPEVRSALAPVVGRRSVVLRMV